MPSLIGADAGSGVNVAENYLKSVARTAFGTRSLRLIKVAGVHNSVAVDFTDGVIGTNGGNGTGAYTDSNSMWVKAIMALQGFVEIYATFTPGTGGFIVAVSDDTANDGIAFGQPSGSAQNPGQWSDAEALIKQVIGADTSVTISTVSPAATGISIS